MMKLRLLSTTAAILLFAAGAASAQGMKQDDKAGAAPAPSAQQKAPAEKSGQPMHSNNGMKANENKSTQNKSDLKQRETTGQAPKSSDADKSKQTTGQAPKSSDMDKSPSATSKGSGTTEMKGKSENGASPKSGQSSQTGMSSSSQQSTESGKTGASSTTTGQGSAAGSAKLSTEQRTRISTVLKQQKVERVEPSKLNVSISVGARIPTSVHLYPLPAEVITIYPEWRGYEYILVGDEILVINPRTHEIVAILEA